MSDLTHDPAEDGFQEIQLTGKQLVFLFMATTVVLVAIFLFGVMVGRGVNAARGGDDLGGGPVSTAAIDSTDPAAAPPQSAEPPSPPAEDEFSYHQRLQGNPGPEETAKPPAQEPAASPAPPAAEPQAAGADGPDVPTSGRNGTWVVQVTALQNRAAAAGIVQRLIGKGYPAFLENPAPGAPVIYRVRIGRYSERREAEQIAGRLEKEEQFSPVVTR